jgi:hypothetical protein
LIKAHPGVEAGALQNVALTAEEMVAADEARIPGRTTSRTSTATRATSSVRTTGGAEGQGRRVELSARPDPAGEWQRGVIIRGLDSYSRACQGLLAIEPGKVFTLSLQAEEVWAAWVNGLRKERPPDILRPVWEKAEGHCLRIARILCLARQVATGHDATGTIGGEAMEVSPRSPHWPSTPAKVAARISRFQKR